jgi:hypothetical protein
MKFGNARASAPNTSVVRNKGSSSLLLPGRKALAQLTRGSPQQQAMSNYAKLVPSGRNAPSYQSIIDMGQEAPKIE